MRTLTIQALTGLVALALLAGPARAASHVEVEMTTPQGRVALGDQVRLAVTVTVSSTARTGGFGGPGFRNYRPPGTPDFEVLRKWTNQSTQISIVNGRARREEVYTYNYTLRARKAGRLTIQPAQVTFQGRTYRAQPLAIQVDAGPAAPPPTQPGQTPNLKGDEDVFVQVVPDKRTAWVGEQVTVTWYLYYRIQLQGVPSIKTPPSTDDFFSEDLSFRQPNSTRTTINGTLYGVLPIYRRALFPLKAGALKIGPMEIEARAVGRSWFSTSVIQRASAPVIIRARGLPKAGRPAGFHDGNVGHYRVTAEVEPAEFDAKSAGSLRVTIQGTGFVHGLKVDKITTLPGFKVRFAGQRTEMQRSVQLSGKRVNEYVLIPKRTGTLRIAPICFPHFDPTVGRYITHACSKTIKVHVTGHLPSGTTPAGATTENVLKRRLKPILRGGVVPHRAPWRLHRSWIRWPVLLAPVLALLALLIGRKVRNLLAGDTEGRRRREARDRAKRRLRLARSYLQSGDRVGFFGEIANVIQEQLSARLGIRVQGLTSGDLLQTLADQGVDTALRDRLVQDLEECDFARFAPAASGTDEMQDVLTRTRKLLTDLERARLTPVKAEPNAKAEEDRP